MARSKKIAPENIDKYIALGLNIAYYRKRAGMTQEQLAAKAGISRAYLGEIEAPKMITTISLEVLFGIAQALNMPAYKLMAFRS
ncbi:helix-turn-helix domain-containing protein [Clostridia bacterium OttesenSCG-928-F22]|nr:helix-turn-helix domain-containing protein [Clostridia bacterium OttesenSCG-928-F22]